MKKSIKLLIVAAIIIAIVTTIFSIKVNATTTGTIKEITVNVREKASVESKLIMQITQDDKVEVLEKSGDWYKIKYNHTEGYVYADFITVEEEVKENTKLTSEDDEVTQTIQAKLQIEKNTGVKIAPTIASDIIYTTSKTEAIEILEEVNEWTYIQVAGIKGWVRNSQIQEENAKIESVTQKEETQKEETKKEETKKEEKGSTKTAYVQYTSVNIRKEPSADASILGKAKLNTEVTILEEVDAVWYKVKVNDQEGYISKDLLGSKKVSQEKKEEENTTSRDGENTDRKEQKKEEKQTKTTAEEKTSEVKTEKKTTTQKESKKTTKTTTKSTKESTKGEQVVAYAKQYLGYKYTYGGASPSTGFDCSGFTSYVYKHFGYNISRSSVAQASEGRKVAKKDLQPGDILIYKNRSLTRVGHVGIYIGNNKMIHASEPGVGVTITNIDSASHKYPQRYVMARRILK